VAGIFAFLWSILGLGVVRSGFKGGAIGAMAFVWYIIGALIGLFISAVILLIISSICKGNTDFEANLRVSAAVMVILPVRALLGFTMGINIYLGTIIGLCVGLYALYLIYHGLVESLKATPRTSKIVMYVLAILVVLFMLMGISAQRRLIRYMDKDNVRELMENTEKN
jgi:hypothetical protein